MSHPFYYNCTIGDAQINVDLTATPNQLRAVRLTLRTEDQPPTEVGMTLEQLHELRYMIDRALTRGQQHRQEQLK